MHADRSQSPGPRRPTPAATLALPDSGPRIPNLRFGRLALLTILLAAAATSQAAPTAISIGPATVGALPKAQTLPMPLTRSGDTAFNVALNYHTVDGSAVAGLDYIGQNTQTVIAPGGTAGQIGIGILAHTGGGPDSTFQVVLDSAVGIGPLPSYSAAVLAPTGNQPYAAVSADFNGDGRPDLAVSLAADNAVAILLDNAGAGATTPSYAAPRAIAVGHNPGVIAVADVNGDGKPDIAVYNRADHSLTVLINTTAPGSATATFVTGATLFFGSGATALALVDVDNDGRPDLVCLDTFPTFNVYHNATVPGSNTANFNGGVTFAVPTIGVSAMAVADLNGDGLPDLLIADASTKSVVPFVNASTFAGANFIQSPAVALPDGPTALAVVDLNGDGVPDLVTANNASNNLSIAINTTPRGSSSIAFAAAQTEALPFAPASLIAFDANGDGKPDLAVTAGGSVNVVEVLINATAPGAATVQLPLVSAASVSTGGGQLLATDYNTDGHNDLVVVQAGLDAVAVLTDTTVPTAPAFALDAGTTLPAGNYPALVAVADLNGDGKPDVVVANDTDDTVSVYLNATPPGGPPAFVSAATFAAGSGPASLALADVNHDGRPDIVVGDYYASQLLVLVNTTPTGASTASFAAPVAFAGPSTPTAIAAADLNGDGMVDLIATSFVSSSVAVLLNTGSPGGPPSFMSPGSISTGAIARSVIAADLNGDGKPDLITTNAQAGTASVLINRTPTGAASVAFYVPQPLTAGLRPYATAAADIDGDGKPDLVVANFGSDSLTVFTNAMAPGAASASFVAHTVTVGSEPAAVAVADLDGDGRPDIVVTDSLDTNLCVLHNRTQLAGTPQFDPCQFTAAGMAPQTVALADLDGDGMRDVIGAANGDNLLEVWRNLTFDATIGTGSATGTISHDLIFSGDFEYVPPPP